MTHRDRAGDPPGRREAAGDAGHRPWLSDARRRFACPTGTAASQGFRAAHDFETGRMAPDVPHRHATRSWPKTLGNRLYGSLSTLLGISLAPPRKRDDDVSYAPLTLDLFFDNVRRHLAGRPLRNRVRPRLGY